MEHAVVSGAVDRRRATSLKAIWLVVALRYRLTWARARSRQGRLILLAAGCLAVATAVVLLGLGGFASAAAAVQSGRAALVAAIVLAALHLNAVFANAFLGIGSAGAISESTLRAYPLSLTARRTIAHGTALTEPLWLLVMSVALGLGAGFGVMGAGSALFGLPAALLFVLGTYCFATCLTRVGEWLIPRPGGLVVVIIAGVTFMMSAPLVPAWIARLTDSTPQSHVMAFVERSLPFAAALAMTTPEASTALHHILILGAGCAVLAALMTAAGRLPRGRRSSPAARAQWEHPVDRLAAMFGTALAPLAGKILRDYLRSPQTRYNFPLALPVLAVMIASGAHDSHGDAFLFALGAAPALGTLATGTFSLNMFGFDGPGFRRYLLLPIPESLIVRTASLVSAIPGMLLIITGAIAWCFLSPDPLSLVRLVMLICAGAGGLMFFNCLGLWASILAPRPIPFNLTFGNKLSVPANIVFIAAMAVFFGLPMALSAAGSERVLAGWWIPLVFFAVAGLFQAATIPAAARVLSSRREAMLAQLESH